MDFFDYFQITSLIILYLLLIMRTIQLRVQGVKAWALGAGKKGIRKITEFSFFFGLPLWTIAVIINTADIDIGFLKNALTHKFLDFMLLRVTGVILISIGLIIYISGLTAFGKSWRIGIDTRNPGKLITKGIFSVTRNPVFLYINLYFIGTFLNYSTVFFLLAIIIELAGIHFQILQEEKFLLSYYGKTYREYIKKVRRYI